MFTQQIVRTLTMAESGVVGVPQVLICDRDRKWSRDVRRRLRDAGIRVVLIPERAPNVNAHAERFVRSIKEECLDRLIPLGARHFRHAVAEFVEHYHRERNHQGVVSHNRIAPESVPAGEHLTKQRSPRPHLGCRSALGTLRVHEQMLAWAREGFYDSLARGLESARRNGPGRSAIRATVRDILADHRQQGHARRTRSQRRG